MFLIIGELLNSARKQVGLVNGAWGIRTPTVSYGWASGCWGVRR